MKKEFRFLHILAVAFLVPLLFSACNTGDSGSPIIRPVKTMLVGSPQDFTTRTFPGKVLATHEAKLAFEVPGRLIALPILEGDKINAGQVLAQIDPKTYQEKYNETKAILLRNKVEYGRYSELVKNGYVSRTEYDQKRAQFLVAQANFNTAEKDLKDTKIIAPFTGVISKKYVKNFENVVAKQQILLLQDLNQFDIEVQVPESLILNLKGGKKPVKKMTAMFESAPNKRYTLSMKEFSSEADPQTQTYRLLTTFPAPKDLNVFPGMSASVIVELADNSAQKNAFILIPSTAVFEGADNKPSVWVVDPKTSQVKRRVVEISRLDQGEIRVLSGLEPGERVVTAGAGYLRENEKVSIMEPLTGSE